MLKVRFVTPHKSHTKVIEVLIQRSNSKWQVNGMKLSTGTSKLSCYQKFDRMNLLNEVKEYKKNLKQTKQVIKMLFGILVQRWLIFRFGRLKFRKHNRTSERSKRAQLKFKQKIEHQIDLLILKNKDDRSLSSVDRS